MAPRLVRLVLPKLHAGQVPIIHDPHRIVVASMGSKFGKTFSMGIWLTLQAWNRYQSVNWWCAPTMKQAKIAWNQILQYIPKERMNINRSDLVIELLRTSGDVHSRIEFRSADHPESLRGEGVHACVVDEAAYWSRDSYISVWTTLSRTRGKLRVISTPKGRNFFYEEWAKGWYPEQRKKHPEFWSYQLPTHANPYVPRESLEEFKANMPADAYRQEILAEFLDDSAGVFRNIRKCQTAPWLDRPKVGRHYVMGIDWAKHEDYSVFTIADTTTNEVVHIYRFNEVDWQSQIKKAIDIAKFWNHARVLMDSTGVGDVPFDSMRDVYPHVEGYNIFNNTQKVALVQKLQFTLERREIGIPPAVADAAAAELQHELEVYGYTLSSQGRFIFSAPEGYHDDTVMSLALANWLLTEEPLVYRYRSVQGV